MLLMMSLTDALGVEMTDSHVEPKNRSNHHRLALYTLTNPGLVMFAQTNDG